MTENAIDPGSNSAARAALASLIDLHGPALLHEPDRLKRQLDGALPDAPRAAELILSSMSEEVPHALLAAHSEEQSRTLFPQLVDRLVRKTGIEHAAATWAVRTWAHALAVNVEGRDAERPDGMRRAADRPVGDGSPRNARDPQVDDAATERQDREASRRSSTAEVLGFGTRPVRLKAPSTVRPTGPLVSPPPAAETLVAFDASRERAADVAADHDADTQLELPVFAIEAAPERTESAIVEVPEPAQVAAPIAEVHEPAQVAAPLAEVHEPAEIAVPEAVAPIASAETPVDFPAAHAPPHDEPRPVVEPAATADVPSTIAVQAAPAAVPAITVPAVPPVIQAGAVTDSPELESPDESPALPFAPQRRSSSRTFALAAAIAAAVIVVGATLWPSPQPRSAPDPAPTAKATPPPRPTPAPATVADATVAPVAITPAPVAPPPVDKPSEPVVAMSQPPVPASATSEPQPSEPRSPPPESVAPPAREVALPVGAETTAPAVVPLTPPAPKPAPRVVVKKPEAPVSRPVAAAPTAPKVAKAVEPRKPTTVSAACTRSTCGSVVSVRPIDEATSRDYEVIVRLDDRTIRAVRMPARWSRGARVHVVGSRFEPAGDR